MKQYTYLSIVTLIVAELLILSGNVLQGLGLHLANMLAIIAIIVFLNKDVKTNNVLQGLTLVILLRVTNLTIPQLFTDSLIQYTLLYGIMFIPIYYVIKSQEISTKELGISFEKLYTKLSLAVLIGIVMGIVEYNILSPKGLINSLSASNLILISITMIIFVGLMEGLIFFSILQTKLENLFDYKYGIFLTGIIFGIMHSTYGSINEILFSTIIGLLLANLFNKTKNIVLIIAIIGTLNIVLFGILPVTGWLK